MKPFFVAMAVGLFIGTGYAQSAGDVFSPSAIVAEGVLRAWPGGIHTAVGRKSTTPCDGGILLDGLATEWNRTPKDDTFRYIMASVDQYVAEDGTIRDADTQSRCISNAGIGRSVLLAWRVTRQPRYAKAAKALRDRMAGRQKDSSYYLAVPFLAGYAAAFQSPQDFTDSAGQLLLMERRPPYKTASDSMLVESLYTAAIVDTLDWAPAEAPERKALIEALIRRARVARDIQDVGTSLWWAPRWQAGVSTLRPNLRDSSLFVYAIAKAVRMGYLRKEYLDSARRGWKAILKETKIGPEGQILFANAAEAGAFMLAASEMEQASTATSEQGRPH
ncbi:MAG: glycoside hydrolase family 88 protein [Acidobacteriaceae bacterium]|nr:glycoside hydrolase family 88 protein [Acidobacteriaceae bacterium]